MLADAPPPYRTIAFDCDSTLSAIEGIDELAGLHAAEIAALTRDAMSGKLALEAVYRRRLETIQPHEAAQHWEWLSALARRYWITISRALLETS